MVYIEIQDRHKIAPLFDGWDETLLWSCLQGYMGKAWADSTENPRSAQIITADFCFFAGVPDPALVSNILPAQYTQPYIFMIPQHDGWSRCIEQIYPKNSKRFMRYALKKEPGVFDADKLLGYTQGLQEGYSLRQIDEELYRQTKEREWSKDLCSQFTSYAQYKEQGLGFAVMQGGRIVAGASSYTVYDKGIEIEIDTQKEHRRKGLALACAAKLILACLEKGLYPSWDAANLASVALAEKLGYHFDKEYAAYEVYVGQGNI